jgi:indolepyruvate ferredoxin oxidoreductase alpha subunit
MKTLGEILLEENSFSEVVMGNTALVRAMIESHTQVVTSYPGSPTPEIAEAIKAIQRKWLTVQRLTGIYLQYFSKV